MMSLPSSSLATLALSCAACGLPAAESPSREYDLAHAFRVGATPPQSQLRNNGRIAPVYVEIHNNGSGRGLVALECVLGEFRLRASVRAESVLQTVYVELPAATPAKKTPQGSYEVTCTARVRGLPESEPGARAVVTRSLRIEPPTLPDFVLDPYPALPAGAFDCASYAPAVAQREVCVAFEARDTARCGDAGRPRLHCMLDHRPSATAPGAYHSGAFSLGKMQAGPHVVRCTIEALYARYESNTTNNSFELAFDVMEPASWRYDLAITDIDRTARPTRVPEPQPGPSRDTPPPWVPGTMFGVHVENVGSMRVFAVQAACEARLPNGVQRFSGTWARPGGDRRAWFAGLGPGESAVVDVKLAGTPPPAMVDVRCTASAAAPRDVSDERPSNNLRASSVAFR